MMVTAVQCSTYMGGGRKLKRIFVVVLILLLLVLTGCAGTSAPAAGSDPVIKIGAVYPLSGNLALLGEESWRGAEVARILRNQTGGISGAKIEFVRADAPDANAAKSEAEKLITRENIKVLLGTYSSGLSLTVR
jgi:branched-chain amino acid transport system substrate-binding protein